MKKLFLFLTLVLLYSCTLALPASAQVTTGYLVRTDCAVITNPMDYGVACLQSSTVSGRTQGHIYVWRGSISGWVDISSTGSGVPGGSDTQVQFNAAGAFAGDSGLTFNSTTNVLTATGGFVGPLTGLASTASALATNPNNCSSGSAPTGITATGAAEDCVDVATQAELDTHSALTGTSAHSATSTNTASRIVTRDASGNFAAGTITATITGNVTGNVTGLASTATALAANGTNCTAGQAAGGVDASGNAEDCVSVGGGGGTPIILDLGNNGSTESADLAKITTTGDTNSIFSEPNSDELRIAVGNKWPASNTADALAADGTNCASGNAPLGVDAAGAVQGCFDVATQTELDTHAALSGTSAHSATSTNTASRIVARDGSGNFAAGTITATLSGNVTGNTTGTHTGAVVGNASTATALAANGTNCSAGQAAGGVDASGNSEGCIALGSMATQDASAVAITGGTVADVAIVSTIARDLEVIKRSYSYCADAGANDSYVCSAVVASDAYYTGMAIALKANTVNTGTASINVNSLGVKSIKKWVSGSKTDPANGDICATQTVDLAYDGTDFVMQSNLCNPASGSISATTGTILKAGSSTTGVDSAIIEDADSINFAKAIEACPTTCLFALDTGVFASTIKTWSFPVNASDTFMGLAAAQTPTNKTIDDSTNTLKITKSVQVELYGPTTDNASGNGLYYFRVPVSLNGTNLVGIQTNTVTAGTTGLTSVQITRCVAVATSPLCSSTTVSMLSTVVSIDSGETSSSTAATAAVINTSNDDVATGQILRFDVTAIHTTPAKGLIVNLDFKLP